MNKRWEQKKLNIINFKNLSKDLDINKIVVSLLALRGIKTFKDAKHFFRPKLSHLHCPFLMKNMHEINK